MKKIIVTLALVVSFNAIAQNSEEVKLELKKMQQALVYGDKEVALSKMYNVIALQGPESTYKDSLTYLYFNKRNYLSCFLVANDVLKREPNNVEILEMSTISLESIGAKSKAVEGYKTLLSKTNKRYHAYKLAGLQYETKAYDEALATIKNAAKLPEDLVTTISFKVNPNYNQDVNLKASIAYLEGIIEEALDKKEEAKAAYERAILEFPDFVLAKSSLSSLTEDK